MNVAVTVRTRSYGVTESQSQGNQSTLGRSCTLRVTSSTLYFTLYFCTITNTILVLATLFSPRLHLEYQSKKAFHTMCTPYCLPVLLVLYCTVSLGCGWLLAAIRVHLPQPTKYITLGIPLAMKPGRHLNCFMTFPPLLDSYSAAPDDAGRQHTTGGHSSTSLDLSGPIENIFSPIR